MGTLKKKWCREEGKKKKRKQSRTIATGHDTIAVSLFATDVRIYGDISREMNISWLIFEHGDIPSTMRSSPPELFLEYPCEILVHLPLPISFSSISTRSALKYFLLFLLFESVSSVSCLAWVATKWRRAFDNRERRGTRKIELSRALGASPSRTTPVSAYTSILHALVELCRRDTPPSPTTDPS